MKKVKKTVVALVIALAMAVSMGVTAMAANATTEKTTTTMTNATEVYTRIVRTHPNFGGPIGIVEGTLTQGKKKTPVYLICLHGTEVGLNGQAVQISTDLLSGFAQKNSYAIDVLKTIRKNIPKNSNILFAGHSLGGMVAQQVAAMDEIKNHYNVINTVTFGSPLISEDGEGTLHRLCDASDPVPYLSYMTLSDLEKQLDTRTTEGESGLSFKAHNSSYFDEDMWGTYDVLGVKDGNATLKLDESTAKIYNAPLMRVTLVGSYYAGIEINHKVYGVSFVL